MNSLELFYRQNGYLEARIIEYDVRIDSVHHRVYIRINIDEGEPTLVEGVGIFGNQYFNDAELLRLIPIKSETRLMEKEVEISTLALLKRYADSGFIETTVHPEIRVNSESHRALVDFIIIERTRFLNGENHLVGLKKTHPKVVQRELLFKAGEFVDYSKFLESQSRLYLTGLFQSVFLQPVPPMNGDSLVKDIRIELLENKYREFNVSIGYGTLDKLRGKMEIYSTNLRGYGRKAGLNTKLSFIQQEVELAYTEPCTFGSRWRTDLNLIAGYQDEPGYSLRRALVRATVGRQFLSRSNFNLSYRREQSSFRKVKVKEVPITQNPSVQSLKLSLILENRDNIFETRKGLYLELNQEIGGHYFQNMPRFMKSSVKFKYFKSTGMFILGTAIDVGWMKAEGGLSAIPLQERFYTGGPNSIRGFGYEQVGPLDSQGTPSGGCARIVWNCLEIRRHLYKMIGMTFFLDAGNVWRGLDEVRLNSLRLSPGVGLRFDTPIGVARLDLGINVDRRIGEKQFRWVFNIGQMF